MQNEFLWEFHKENLQWKQPRVGPVPNRQMAKLYKVGMRYPDAVVYDKGQITIYEFKMRPNVTAIGQLEYYAKEFRDTPEFSDYAHLVVNKVFVTTYEDRKVRQFCEEKGIKYLVYQPHWVSEYLKTRFGINL